VIDLKGAYLAPSLIDGHFHVESSMLTAPEFARAVVPHGTGAVVIDPHEYANVLGLDGIRYVLESTKNLPWIFSSCCRAACRRRIWKPPARGSRRTI
jgi:adenine deaminase